MKIVMIYPNFQSEKGISNYSLTLINGIKRQEVDIDGLTFIRGKPSTINLKNISKYDTIHVQHEYNLLGWFGIPYFFLLGYLWLLKNKSLVITMHTILSQNEKFKSGKIKTFLRKILYKIQNRFIDWTCDKIIVHSKVFKNILVEEYFIPKEKIEVIHHPIIENIKTLSKQKARKELNIKENEKVYLLIGTMIPDHGQDKIIRQADKIKGKILVATNPSTINYKNIEKIKSYLELNKKLARNSKNVRFDLGEISNEKWWKYFSACDLVLLPYQGGIGSGIFADAMVMKKPVVSSTNNYFWDIATDYSCVMTSKNYPCAIELAMEEENYEKMVKECERYVKENGITPISKRYKDFYSNLKEPTDWTYSPEFEAFPRGRFYAE